jgi:phage gpG-like protein
MITATVDASALKARLNGTAAKAFASIRDAVTVQTGMLAEYIKRDKLSGQVLKNRSGNLRNSVFPLTETSGSVVTGQVYVDNTAPYGRYQEYGAHIPERVPVNAKALRWYVGGSPVFAMRARAFTLPARPFMAPSLDERAPAITAAIQESVNKVTK